MSMQGNIPFIQADTEFYTILNFRHLNAKASFYIFIQ